MSLPGLSLEEGVSALELVWHTVVKNNGTSVKVLGPKDLFDPVPSQLQDILDRPRTQRGILTRDIHNEISATSNKSTLSTGLSTLAAATATSTYTTLAAEISSAGTYSPKRTVENENLNYATPRPSIIGTPSVKPSHNFGTGFTSGPWSDNPNQGWGRQAFGIQLAKSIKTRESVHAPWPLPPTPIGSPSLTVQQPSQPTQTQTAHSNPNFERWCRNRLLDDKTSPHGSTVEDTPKQAPIQSPTIAQPLVSQRFLLPAPGKEIETGNTEPVVVEDACDEQGKKIISLSNSESSVRGEGKRASNCGDSPRPNTRICKFLKHRSGCTAGVDCPYIHPGRKRTPSPKKVEADSLTGIGPRAIIMRGTSTTGKVCLDPISVYIESNLR